MTFLLFVLLMSLRLDSVQRGLALYVTDEIAGSYGIPIEVEAVDVRGFNDLRLKKVLVRDLAGDTMIYADEARAYLQTAKLLKGNVDINTLMLAAPDVRLNREAPGSPLNFQFVIDALNSGKKKKKKLDIRINQLSVYDARIVYDVLSEDVVDGRFDPNHIAVNDLCCNVSLKRLTKESLDLNIRSISGLEKNGFILDKFKARVTRNEGKIRLSNLELSTPRSSVVSDNLEIRVDSALRSVEFIGDVRSDCFSLVDIAPFVTLPESNIAPLAFDIAGYYGNDSLNADLSIAMLDESFSLSTNVDMLSPFAGSRRGEVVLNECNVAQEMLAKVLAIAKLDANDDLSRRFGDLSLQGEAFLDNGSIEAVATLLCESGVLSVRGTMRHDGKYHINAKTRDLKLERLAGVAGIDGNIKVEAVGCIKNPKNYADIKGQLLALKYNGYSYAPIDFVGKCTDEGVSAKIVTDDPNAKALLTARYRIADEKKFEFSLKASDIKPYNLHLLDSDNGQRFAFNLNGDFFDYGSGKTILNAKFDNFYVVDNEDSILVRNFYVSDNRAGEDRMFVVNSDFAKVSIYGRFDFPTIVSGLTKSMKQHLPVFEFGSRKAKSAPQNEFYYDIAITNSNPLTHILGLPVTVHEPSRITGTFNDSNNLYTIDGSVNRIEVGKTFIRQINVKGNSTANGLELNAQVQKPFVRNIKNFDYNDISEDVVVRFNANIKDNDINGVVNWNNFKQDNVDTGILRMDATFSRDSDGDVYLDAMIRNDSIIHKNSVWHIDEGTIAGKISKLLVENVGLHSENQSLKIAGVIGKGVTDSLNVYLKDVDVATVFDFINFKILRFDGKATGRAYVTGILSDLNADGHLLVNDFCIDGADLGKSDMRIGWDNDSKSMYLDAGVYNHENDLSTVKGFISQVNDTITLKINANNLNAAFIDSKLKSFLCETEGACSGNVHINGSWRAVDLDGALALYCAAKVKATNVKYYFTGDSIKFSKGVMSFNNARLYDRYGNMGTISGNIKHRHLAKWTCLFNLKSNEMLVYDTDNFGSLPFYGSVFGTGDAIIKSDSTGLLLKAKIKSEPHSHFVYNSNETSGARDNSFVTFTDNNKNKKNTDSAKSEVDAKKVYSTTASKLTLDFMLDVNENLELKVYTNLQTDDYISLYGTGPINAVFNDKTGFSMKGHLDLARGTYKFTIQDIFPKVFDIIKGSTLAFDGDPYKAQLNLKTKYLVPSASLSDLTTEIAKRKTVKVNCIMNITGSLAAPDLAFDLELPEGSEEERELLASIASTPDQKNMQFVYLLGVGKFYTFDTNSAQAGDVNTSTAVESLISNTISSQLNNMLGKIINNGNWDISGNISTSERGWNSMEVEGMLRGRLLNNRLQINGNLGYRENPIANRNFIGDFELQWLLSPKYNWSIKAYSKTNDRYFSKTDLTTQGVGTNILFEFDSWKWWGNKNDKTKKRKLRRSRIKKQTVEEQIQQTEAIDSIQMKDIVEIK
ncbi:MAG: translocation/assembly module TamB domain-containing protein [Bacteroidaceae bacterium]|nr:translocation/assembly module TamB domain-containing protein [Bacteroidaceae bacterium]